VNKVSGNPDKQRFVPVAGLPHQCRAVRRCHCEIDGEYWNRYDLFSIYGGASPGCLGI